MKKLLLLSALAGMALQTQALSMDFKIGAVGGMTFGSTKDKTKANAHKIAKAHGAHGATGEYAKDEKANDPQGRPIRAKNLFDSAATSDDVAMDTEKCLNFGGFLAFDIFSRKTDSVDLGFGMFGYVGRHGFKAVHEDDLSKAEFNASGLEFFVGPSVSLIFGNNFRASLIAGITTFGIEHKRTIKEIARKALPEEAKKFLSEDTDEMLKSLSGKEISAEPGRAWAFGLGLLCEYSITDSISAVLLFKTIPRKTVDLEPQKGNEVSKQVYTDAIKEDISFSSFQISAGLSYTI